MATAQIDEKTTVSTTESCAVTGKCRGWKSIVGKILLVLAAGVAVLCVFIAMQPDDFHVSRTATMASTPDAVFSQVNDFHNWEAWSPWAKLDPNAKSTFEGPTSGEGSKFSWDGNSDVGAGSMTILESKPNERVRIKLDFVRPFEGTSDVVFTLKPEGDNTAVTWSMAGKNNFIAKAIGLVIDCDKMIGESYEKGLASIKSIVEAKPAQPSET
jgi:Polyketide cyclase / dehydrase and lipid transport